MKNTRLIPTEDGTLLYEDRMPDDPLGVVLWEPEHSRIARCGQYVMESLGKHCCGRMFRFRACNIQGGIVIATVCNQCGLEYNVVERKSEATAVNALMDWVGCSREEAIASAWKRWGWMRPVKKKKEKKNKPSRSPLAEDDQ